VIYNTKAQNATNWSFAEMEVSGEEVCDDSGVCYAYADSTAKTSIKVNKGETIYLMILAYDGSGLEYGSIGAEGKSAIYNYTISGGPQDNIIIDFPVSITLAIVGVCILFFFILYFIKKKKNK
jgi:hypothetical protein